MDKSKISKALEDWKKSAKKEQQASNLAAGNASTISYSHSSSSQSTSQSEEPDDIEVSPSAAPDHTDEINLKDYLEKYIEGYLIGDLETLTHKVGARERFNCSFVIVLTICAGIEFLGFLLNPKDEESRGRNRSSFCYYWKNYLDDKYEKAIKGGDAYNLIRNGLAHCFMVKHRIGTIRLRPNEHLKIGLKDNQNILKIDADTFFEDFKKSYEKAKEKLFDNNDGEQLAKRRLSNQLEQFKVDSADFFNHLNQEDIKSDSSGTTTALDISTIP